MSHNIQVAGPASSQVSSDSGSLAPTPELDFHVHGQRALDLEEPEMGTTEDPGLENG